MFIVKKLNNTIYLLGVSTKTISRSAVASSDIDECLVGTHNCASNSFCYNVNGSFNCWCRINYLGGGEWDRSELGPDGCQPFPHITREFSDILTVSG